MVELQKTTRHWQNLVFKKCPNCDTRLEDHPRGFFCPEVKCNFFITRDGMYQILTDKEHAALRFISRDAREVLEKTIKEIQQQR